MLFVVKIPLVELNLVRASALRFPAHLPHGDIDIHEQRADPDTGALVLTVHTLKQRLQQCSCLGVLVHEVQREGTVEYQCCLIVASVPDTAGGWCISVRSSGRLLQLSFVAVELCQQTLRVLATRAVEVSRGEVVVNLHIGIGGAS